MKLFPRCVSVFALLVTFGSFGCKRTPTFSRTTGGVIESSGGWQVQAGTTHVEDSKPGVFFSTRQAPGGAREISYFFIYRHPSELEKVGFEANANSEGRAHGDFVHESLSIRGQKLDVALELVRDESSTYKVADFKINGQATDLSKGRVFLVDFVSTPLSVRQIDAPLPADVPKAETPVEVKEMIERFLREITAASEEARTLVRQQK